MRISFILSTVTIILFIAGCGNPNLEPTTTGGVASPTHDIGTPSPTGVPEPTQVPSPTIENNPLTGKIAYILRAPLELGGVYLYDLDEERSVHFVERQRDGVVPVCPIYFFGDNKLLFVSERITGNEAINTLYTVDMSSHELTSFPEIDVSELVISSNRREAVALGRSSSYYDSQLFFLDEDLKIVRAIPWIPGELRSLSQSPDGRFVASVTLEGTVVVLDTLTSQRSEFGENVDRKLDWSNDSSKLAYIVETSEGNDSLFIRDFKTNLDYKLTDETGLYWPRLQWSPRQDKLVMIHVDEPGAALNLQLITLHYEDPTYSLHIEGIGEFPYLDLFWGVFEWDPLGFWVALVLDIPNYPTLEIMDVESQMTKRFELLEYPGGTIYPVDCLDWN